VVAVLYPRKHKAEVAGVSLAVKIEELMYLHKASRRFLYLFSVLDCTAIGGADKLHEYVLCASFKFYDLGCGML
jgi:hypothetical protein